MPPLIPIYIPGKENTAIIRTYKDRYENTPEALKTLVEDSLDADKAEDIISIDLKDQSAIADYMVIATGRSTRQVGAMAHKLHDRLKASGHEHIRMEGLETCNWVVVDAGDIIVHIFRPDVREYYNLEKMWDISRGSCSIESALTP